MKPITFEAIRNLLKTKKKNKDKGIDQSFKRSDSFKRISIRKSYLERGRKRGVLRSKTVLDISELELKSNVSSIDRCDKSREESFSDCSSHEPSIIAELERKDASIDEKIRALQEINERYLRENQRSKEGRKAPVPKPPRNSKLKKDKVPKDLEVKTEILSKPSTLETTNKNTCDTNDINTKITTKTVSQINILFTGDTDAQNSNSMLNKTISIRRDSSKRSKSVEDDQSSFYSVSTFTLDSQADQGTTSTRNSEYTRSISYPQGVDKDQDSTSFLTFSTYCQSGTEYSNYLETNFDGAEPNTTTNNATINSDSGIGNKTAKKNISTLSLVYEPVNNVQVKPVINTQTFKMPKSKSREGVIIKIPAISQNSQLQKNKTQIVLEPDCKDHLNRQASNDSAVEADANSSSVEMLNQIHEKTNINATITYERICKAFEKQEAKYKKNPKKDRRKDVRRERLETHLSTPRKIKLEQEKKQEAAELHQSNESLPVSSPDRYGTFDFPSPRGSTFDISVTETSINTGTYDKTTTDKFTYPKDYFEEENNISYKSPGDDDNPESMPIPLKIRENPFTKHKEIYPANSTRIWKQVNLGQEEEISLISSHPLPINPSPLKPKNESFKSMSSHDSGFSLTLTKPKNLFRRKSKKQRRKPKLSVSRDGYFKRVMVVQRNSTKRKKNAKKSRPQGKDVFKIMYNDNWSKLGSNYDENQLGQFENQGILKDFENFCNRNKNFNKEISDLEEFYEEHLKRLKHYYLQRKQMNEIAIREFYRDYTNDEEFYDAHIVSRNDTFRFKRKKTGRESPEYLFPYPDKRVAIGKKRSKTHFPEVRTFKSHIFGSKYNNNSSGKDGSIENLKSNKDFLQFPYWKLARKVSKRERVGPKLIDTYVDPFDYDKNEISLADIFPSVNETTQPEKASSDSDEFSEQEFIANCLGDDLYCSTCDKNNSDCECYIDDENDKQVNKGSMSKLKSIKRRRSKNRIRKNHSTLRRDYFHGKPNVLFLFYFIFFFNDALQVNIFDVKLCSC